MNLIEVDALDIQVIVDNTTDSLSTVPKNVVHEMSYLRNHGMQELAGECLCCGAHGLALLITATKDEKSILCCLMRGQTVTFLRETSAI